MKRSLRVNKRWENEVKFRDFVISTERTDPDGAI